MEARLTALSLAIIFFKDLRTTSVDPMYSTVHGRIKEHKFFVGLEFLNFVFVLLQIHKINV